MGNYFSRQNKESIEIINEIDHVHVIVSNSDKKNESGCVNNDETVQVNQGNSNKVEVGNILNDHDHEKKIASNEIDTNNQEDKNNKISQPNNIFNGFNEFNEFNEFNGFNGLNDIVCKKNLKKRKCKKNKKKHLQ
jgi:hypothetical protein